MCCYSNVTVMKEMIKEITKEFMKEIMKEVMIHYRDIKNCERRGYLLKHSPPAAVVVNVHSHDYMERFSSSPWIKTNAACISLPQIHFLDEKVKIF